MKKLILLSLLFIFSITQSQAQYESLFGQNDSRWVMEWGNFFGGTQDTIYIVKDTSFAGKDWKEITCTPAPWGDLEYPGGFLSEDTITGKVWYKSKWDAAHWPDTSIILAFDFSLQIGDTFNIDNVWGSVPDSLRIVDSVYYENGRKIIQFKKYIVSGERFSFMEGIGSNLGIIYKQYIGYMQSHYLLCAYKGNTEVYLNDYYGTCDVHQDNPNSTEKILKENIRVYPNPSTGLIFLDIPPTLELTSISIYNPMGQLVQQANPHYPIDISTLPQGIYFMEVSSKIGLKTSISILKQ